MAISELDAIRNINQRIKSEIKEEECTRAILVGHNASFDLNFILAAAKRTKIKLPFHQFSTIDTVSLSSIYYGETVLAKAIKKAKIEWDDAQAHSALYDAKKTAELFCLMFNNFDYQG
jgi:ribonuclease T